MRVAFRTDASRTIGTGHVVRCMTLADALRVRGASAIFVCREHEGHLCDLIEERGFTVNRLPAAGGGAQSENSPTHAGWLGASWEEDAEQTRAAIETLGAKPDWLVVDHYALDRRWESRLRACVGRVMAIDDLADRAHDCDLLLDQNLAGEMHSRYAGKIPAARVALLGPEYALLQPVYAELHDRARRRAGPVRRIFMFFSGVDGGNVVCRALAAFLRLDRPDIEVDVVIGAGDPHEKTLRLQAQGHGNIHLHGRLPTLAPLMARADLAIGASGTASWERLCLGLPALVVTLAENQRAVADEMNRRGLIRWLGHRDEVTESVFFQELNELARQGMDEDWSARCLATVDGRGVKRVCAALIVTATAPLEVRRAGPEDEALLLEWANDPTVRRNAFSPERISAATHRIWFRDRLGNPDGCRLYIVETTDGVPLGQVRFERSEEIWEIHYALGPAFRGRGLGRRMLEAALAKFRAEGANGAVVIGRVKTGNRPSRRIFESLGFTLRPGAQEGIVVYQRAI